MLKMLTTSMHTHDFNIYSTTYQLTNLKLLCALAFEIKVVDKSVFLIVLKRTGK